MIKQLFHRMGPVGRQALILAGGNGIFYFAWAFACYQTVYLQNVGFSASSLGVVNAICSAVGIASVAFWGMVSDKTGSLRRVLIIVLAGNSILYALIPQIPTGLAVSQLLLFCYVPVVNFFRASMTTYADNLLVRNCNELGLNFGVLRSVGSLLFTVSSLMAAAWLPTLGVRNTFWLTGVLMIVPILFTAFSREPAARAVEKKSGGKKEKNKLNLGELFQNKAYMAFLIFGFLFYIAAACGGNYIPFFMESIGVDSQQYGVILAYRAILEIPFLVLMLRLRRKFSLRVMVLGAAVLMSLESLGFGFFANSLSTMLLFCTFFGLGNGLFLGSSANYIYELAPSHLKASAQAFFTSVASVAGILGNLLGGVVYDAIGAKPFYLLVGGIYLLSAGVFLVSFRRKSAGQNGAGKDRTEPTVP
ncbi:MFS transporter [Acutalibacter sp. 1XD8-33]|uniref:MFS transporter n=1 Tax=Acutalibacter sp. 1XD8-33 TaxID=2320081 RepID=UPI000EA298BA|nr:MFS transporter [Acutalibacter sp. 1XD8-33]RKJ39386.1 MFS transporter [Acutalibacter sp. 1XD8-33]